jgi:lysophospholipase L1-like esterase
MAEALQQLCSELGLQFVDLTPPLVAAAAKGEVVYLPLDTHLSPRGHEVVGQAIADVLQSTIAPSN